MAKKEKVEGAKKPIYKKWWFWVIIVVVIAGIGGMGGSDSTDDKKDETPVVAESEKPAEDTRMEVTIEVEPNVNSEDGSVLFGVTTNLPEDTKLMVTVSNEEGFTAQDTATILKNGTGYTAEFSNHGEALSGKYNVHVSMSLPKLQAESVQAVIGANGENIKGDLVDETDGTVTADFEFEF